MNPLQKGVLTLIRSSLTGKALPLAEDFPMEKAFPLFKKHQIVGLAYEGAVLCGVDKHLPTMQELFPLYYQAIIHNEKQLRVLSTLFAEFEAAGIDYMPLKGCNLKLLYPKPEMRVMGDADILFHEEQYDAIVQIVERLGYNFQLYYEGVYHWMGSVIQLELHKYLISDGNLDFIRYYEDSWRHTFCQSGHRYAMKAEDEFVYLFVHYAEHYRNGGIGLRQLIDLWLWQNKYELDMDYVRAQLEQLRLSAFFDNTQRMLRVWFADAEPDEKTDFMTDFIFSSGSWGTLEHSQTADGLKMEHKQGSRLKGQMKMLLTAVFPPVSWLKDRYPILEKAPWLLPLIWPVRWVTALLFRFKNVRTYRRTLQNASGEKMDSYSKALQYVGLDFYY